MARYVIHSVIATIFAFVILGPNSAIAQQITKICVTNPNATNPGNSCVPVDSNNPLPVTSGGGSASDTNITQVGGNAVSTMIPISGTVTATTTGTQNVAGTGSAGSPATGVVTVQGISNGYALTVSNALGSTFTPTATTLGTTGASVLAAGTATTRARVVCNEDSLIVEYIGGSASVTSADGIPRQPNTCFDVSKTTAQIFGVAASGTPIMVSVQY